MPRGKGSKGRRGGRKTAAIVSVDIDSAVETDIISGHKNASELGIGEADESMDECTDIGLTADDVPSLETPSTTQTLECSTSFNNDRDAVDEKFSNELNKEKESGSEAMEVEKLIKTTDQVNHVEEQLKNKSIHLGGDIVDEVKDNQETELLLSEQQEVKQVAHESRNNGEAANEGMQVLDITENADNNPTNAAGSNDFKKQNETIQSGNSVDSDVYHETVSADLIKYPLTEFKKAEELENSKFEESSVGSIEQVSQDELSTETNSDIKMTVEVFEPKKVQDSEMEVNDGKGKIIVTHKESQLQVEVLSLLEDSVKLTAENKDTKEISNDGGPSKKRRKSLGQTPEDCGNDVKDDINMRPDMQNAGGSDAVTEKVPADKIDVKVQKHAASEDVGGYSNSSSNKRIKLSDDKSQSGELLSKYKRETKVSSEMCHDLKKEEKRLQAKDVNISYSKIGVLSNRNVSHSSKYWRQKSTERSISSRELVACQGKCDFVDSSCQSEPRIMKGKIVQCNIKPIKSAVELDKQEKNIEKNSILFEWLNKLKHKLPSIIPDAVMSDVTSLEPSQKKGIYSFSMGPLLLTDMYSSAFQDVLGGTENFSLVFDNHCQGIFKATFSKPDNISSLLTRLNHQELSTGYMVMSILYNCDEEGSDYIWTGILVFVKEQGMQTKSCEVVVNEESKLYLRGVPKVVSTAFIHLIFPEAQNVTVDTGASNGDITLEFSSTRTVESVLSSYSLLIINGSQISISRVKPRDDQQDVAPSTEAGKELDIVIKKDTDIAKEHTGRHGQIGVNSEQITYYNSQQKELDMPLDADNKHIHESSEQQQPSQALQSEVTVDLGKHVDSSAADGAQGLQRGHGDMATNDTSLIEADSTDKSNVVEMTCTNICSGERTGLTDGATGSDDAAEQISVGITGSKKTGGHGEETWETINLGSASSSADSAKKTGEDKTSSVIVSEETSKLKAIIQDKTPKDISTLESEAEKAIENVDSVSTQEKVHEKVEDSELNKTSAEEERTSEAVKKTSGENLKDVSDDELASHNKHKDVDVAILREDSSKSAITDVGLTNQPKEAMKCGSDVSVKGLSHGNTNKERSQKFDSQSQEKICTKVVGASSNGECIDSKLVMTDGSLEVSMEVIDVDDDEDGGKLDKVIYSRTWPRSQDRPTEAASYFEMTGRENMGANLYASQFGMYQDLQGQYRDSPAAEGSIPGAPRHSYPWPPFIESTAPRRDTLPRIHRSRSPSPRRDVARHSHNYISDHRWTSEQRNRSHDSQRPGTYEDSRRVESYSKASAESRSRSGDSPGRSGNQHMKSGEPSSHRDTYYSEQRQDYKKLRSPSLSKLSESSESQIPALRKSPYRRGSPRRISRSPISASSRSQSSSPVSKSSSLDHPHTGSDKEELVKTVEHFLKLAKGLQHTKKRRHARPKSYRLSPSRRSPSPVSRSSYTKRSRSPQPASSRISRSPSYTRSSRYKYKRSQSPPSQGDDHKKPRGEESFSDRKSDSYPTKSGSPRNYESKKSVDIAYKEQSSQSKSGKWPEAKYSEPYRSLSDQPWQQSGGEYQPQNSGRVPTSHIFDPSCPPPGCPPRAAQSSMYPSSSMPMFPFGGQSPFSVPPPCMPPVPRVTSFPPPYQSPYSMYPPRF